MEVASALNRLKNERKITQNQLYVVLGRFYADVEDKVLSVMGITQHHIVHAAELILSHNLRSNDGLIFSCLLDVRKTQRDTVFVCSDMLLIKAARKMRVPVVVP